MVFPNVCPYVESVNVHDQPRKIEHFIEPTSPCLFPPKQKNPTPSMNMVGLSVKYNKMNYTVPKQYKYIISK